MRASPPLALWRAMRMWKEAVSLSEDQLAQLAAAGDRSAMEELAVSVHAPLTRYFLKLSRHNEDARDLTQLALIRMMEKLHLYRAGPDSHFRAWLFKLAYHVFIDEVRKKKPPPVDVEILERMPDGADGHGQTEDRAQVEALLSRLSDELRSMVILRYYVDLDYEDIGKAMGCSAKRVKWRLHDALEKMRKEAGI